MDDDSRVVPLPGRRRLTVSATPPSKPNDTHVLRAEIDALLGDDDPADTQPPDGEWLPSPSAGGLQAPSPKHRHAATCPQCDGWTWRHTEHCVHCGFNLFEYTKQQALDKARRQRALERARVTRWVTRLAVTGLALTGLQLWIGALTDGWLFLAALACFYAASVMYKALPDEL